MLDVRPGDATVVIGTREDLLVDGGRVSDMVWVSYLPPYDPLVDVKVRYRSDPVAARLVGGGGDWEIWFDGRQEAAAAGQAAVVYRGAEVLGGGTVEGPLRR